jgi:hypothetical protein
MVSNGILSRCWPKEDTEAMNTKKVMRQALMMVYIVMVSFGITEIAAQRSQNMGLPSNFGNLIPNWDGGNGGKGFQVV